MSFDVFFKTDLRLLTGGTAVIFAYVTSVDVASFFEFLLTLRFTLLAFLSDFLGGIIGCKSLLSLMLPLRLLALNEFMWLS